MKRTLWVCLGVLWSAVAIVLAAKPALAEACHSGAILDSSGNVVLFSCSSGSCQIGCQGIQKHAGGETVTVCGCNGYPSTCCHLIEYQFDDGTSTVGYAGNCGDQDQACNAGAACDDLLYYNPFTEEFTILPLCD